MIHVSKPNVVPKESPLKKIVKVTDTTVKTRPSKLNHRITSKNNKKAMVSIEKKNSASKLLNDTYSVSLPFYFNVCILKLGGEHLQCMCNQCAKFE
jgi:hypothetical protein